MRKLILWVLQLAFLHRVVLLLHFHVISQELLRCFLMDALNPLFQEEEFQNEKKKLITNIENNEKV